MFYIKCWYYAIRTVFSEGPDVSWQGEICTMEGRRIMVTKSKICDKLEKVETLYYIKMR